ncbi:MAG: response regulator [Helicobacteraceae bacterium]|nr:response regulator [Helicobacteraceae bacterium]
MSLANVIIVEDDEVTAMNLKMSLEKQDYCVVHMSTTIDNAKSNINSLKPDIIFIDIFLENDNDGVSLGQYIHDELKIPFIYLTSHDTNETLELAKSSEPSAYMIKPFEPKNLHSTIQMALYKSEQELKRDLTVNELENHKAEMEKLLYNKKTAGEEIVTFGDYYLDLKLNETFYKDQKIKLTKKENAFIRLLIARLDQVVDFQEVMDYIWENQSATENNIRTLVWRLRSKLPTEVIKSSSGTGYYIES